jgi:hypothetical protein
VKRAIIGFALAFSLGSAVAQTVANGPYYATPSWDQTLPAVQRFIVLANMNSEAVLDRETGLVWERSAISTILAWTDANQNCIVSKTGNRWGWRLPTVQEFSSLFDATPGNPLLQAGHPFQNVEGQFWTATTAFNPVAHNAYGASPLFNNNPPSLFFIVADKGSSLKAWCVRGGQGVDTQ